MMINKQKLVNPENLPVIEWQGVRVVTTETLAAGYGTTPIRIQQNYIRNEDRFVEGKHFFKISGDELKSFRLSFSESVNKHTTSLVLWTERGAARMSKIVDTDEAWLFFEKMEQAYFRKATPSSNTIPDFDDPIAAAEAWIEAKKSERLALGYAERQARYISKLESHLADGITPVQFCKQLNGVNTRQINAFLEERNWLYDDRPEAMYTIVDRIGTRILRDPYTNKPFVGFYTTKRTGGMLVDSQAIKLMKIGAATRQKAAA